MFLVFDTETNGLPGNRNFPAEYVDNWPRIVQLSWGIYDRDGNEVGFYDYIIKPNNFTITEESSKIHGITNEIANREGHPIKDVLYEFKSTLKTVKYIVSHNYHFDINTLGAECIRNNVSLSYKTIQKEICTMKLTTNFCKIPFSTTSKRNRYKWPRLQELYTTIFGKSYEHCHNSKYDVRACAKCLFYCIENNIILV